jgi:hypothetical protein
VTDAVNSETPLSGHTYASWQTKVIFLAKFLRNTHPVQLMPEKREVVKRPVLNGIC